MEFAFFRITPSVTVENMNSDMYHDVLGTFTVNAESDPNRDVNLQLACEALNGTILYPGDIFSFNKVVGERTTQRGYLSASPCPGNGTEPIIGGGICQVSSALYYSAMLADLETIERHGHTYVTDYLPLGADAYVSWKTQDFRFRNDSNKPIRIDAIAEEGNVTITIMGVDTKDYYVLLESEVLKTLRPHKIYQVINPGSGYTDGQVTSTSYTGYEVNLYRCKYSKVDNELLSQNLEALTKYSSRNEIIVKIEQQPVPELPPEPSAPEVTEPEVTGPDVTGPDVTEPEVTLPEVTEPEVTVPESTGAPTP